MASAEYREPFFIWKNDDGREKIIADISWMLEDYGETLLFNPENHLFSGLYGRIMGLLQLYINSGHDNAYCGFIALGKILEVARDSNNINVLYIGENELRFEFLVNLLKMLSPYPVVAINRCTLCWVKGNRNTFFYGGFSENNKVNIRLLEDDDFCYNAAYNLIIYDVDHKKVNRNKLLHCLKDNGGMLLFTSYRKYLQEGKEEIFGDENVGYWKYCKRERCGDDDLLSRIRICRVDKLRALLENLKEELPYLKPQTFENMYYIRNCERILRDYSNKVRDLFEDYGSSIEKEINQLLEGILFYRNHKTNPCDNYESLMHLVKTIETVLLKIDRAKVNKGGIITGEEKHIEFIVKNDLVKQGWYEYHFDIEKMHFYNWYPSTNMKTDWLYKFVSGNFLGRTRELNFYSVHGDDLRPRFMEKENKILYVYEDVCKRFMDYRDFCMSSMNLIIGGSVLASDKKFHNKYVEFPYWIRTMFDPIMDIKIIRKRIDEINNARSNCKYECALIASHDMYRSRTELVRTLEDIIEIQCPGKFNHNSDMLKNEFADNKRAYLKNFMFCACPENVSEKGWVTEKIFDAFASGAIPIYYGAHNKPIPEIINQDAVLFFDNGGDNLALKKRIMELKSNPNAYDQFIRQKKLLKGTDEYVYDRIHDVYERLKEFCM